MAFKEYNRNAPVYGELLAPDVDMVAGRLVMIDPAAPTKIKYADGSVNTEQIIGILGQNVVAPTYNTHWLMSVHTQYARYGEPVAVFYNDIYWTDQGAVNIAAGDRLWATTNGQFTNVEVAGQKPVGIALSDAAAGQLFKVKLLV